MRKISKPLFNYQEEIDYKNDFSDSVALEPYKFENGSVYRGMWKYGMKHGFGQQYWPDGNYYEGLWKNNMKHGKGRLISPSKDILEGIF